MGLSDPSPRQHIHSGHFASRHSAFDQENYYSTILFPSLQEKFSALFATEIFYCFISRCEKSENPASGPEVDISDGVMGLSANDQLMVVNSRLDFPLPGRGTCSGRLRNSKQTNYWVSFGRFTCQIPLLVKVFLFMALNVHIASTQNCPNYPTYIQVTNERQFFVTPGYPSVYPPNVDCAVSLKTADPNHRIHITVHDSELEERLFTECADFISIRDGNSHSALELARWCGRENPLSVSGHEESLLITFHTDFSVHRKGVNISFIQFRVPGCPPGWSETAIEDSAVQRQCYKIVDLSHTERGNPTWLEAQRFCNFEEADLFTADSEDELKAIVHMVAANESIPWIGYHDANSEGTFQGIDGKPTIPTNPLVVRGNDAEKDCVVLDTDGGEGSTKIYHAAKDCRDNHPILCKRIRSGNQPIHPPLRETVRKGYVNHAMDYTFWILIIVALLLILILFFILFRACKKKKQHTRVHAQDSNMKLVSGLDGTDIRGGQQNNQTTPVATGAARLATDTSSNLPSPHSTAYKKTSPPTSPQNIIVVKEASSKRGSPPMRQVLTDKEVIDAQLTEKDTAAPVETTYPQPKERTKFPNDYEQPSTSYEWNKRRPPFESEQSQEHLIERERPILEASILPQTSKTSMPPLHLREQTYQSLGRDESFLRTKRTSELFDRPKMTVLDNVSAISLDEFWHNAK